MAQAAAGGIDAITVAWSDAFIGFIPGSMGTASWVLLGQPNSMNLSFGSTAHGAGRTMSRSKARRNYTEADVKKSLNDKGIYIKALTRDGVVEETKVFVGSRGSFARTSDPSFQGSRIRKPF